MTKDEKEKVVASWLEMFFELTVRKINEVVTDGNDDEFLAWQKAKVLELVEALLSPDFARAERARVARPQVKKAPQVTSEAAKFLKGKLAPKANFGDVMEAARKVIAAVPDDGKVPVDQIPKKNITTVPAGVWTEEDEKARQVLEQERLKRRSILREAHQQAPEPDAAQSLGMGPLGPLRPESQTGGSCE